MTLLRPVVQALVLVSVLAAASFANVGNASAYHLSAGTDFGIDGTDFGTRPTAWLDFSGRHVPLKIAKGGTETHLDVRLASVPKGVHGACQLKVRPKGVKVPFSLAGMTIELPAPTGPMPVSGTAGTEVTITGSYFGTKRGHVDFGTKRGRVIEWTDTLIRVTVPKHLPAGTVNLHVVNQAGESVNPTGFEILS